MVPVSIVLLSPVMPTPFESSLEMLSEETSLLSPSR